MAKLGFVLLVLLFGACSFIAGVVAPTEISKPVRRFAQIQYERWYPPEAETALNELAAQVDPLAAKAIDYNSLIHTPELAGKVGIQVGLYSSQNEAQVLQAELDQLKLPAQAIPVKIAGSFSWVLLATGPYKDAQQARLSVARLRGLFGYDRAFDLIRWPEKAK